MEKYKSKQKWPYVKKGHPPVPVNRSLNHPETWHTYSGGASLTFHS